MKYICSNCGYLQDEIGVSGGCAHDFWGWCIIVTLLISLFYWVGFIVLAFEILFFILTSGKSNCCKKCKAKDCVIPVNTPRGEKIFNEYYEYVEEETEQEEQEQLTGEIETQSDDENDYTFTKIKVQKTKSWKELAQENRTTLIMIAVGFLILWLVCLVLIPLTSSDAKKDIEQAKPVQKTETTNENKLNQISLSKEQCDNNYKKITIFWNDFNNINALSEIDNYYNSCGQYAPRDKNSFLHVFYSGKGLDLYNKNDFENAAKYYQKALEANLKSNDKLNIEFDYLQIGDCYFNIWQMEKAKKYYKLALPLVPKGPYIYEKLGDTCYNLQQYDEAEEYYKKGLDHVLKLYQDPKMTNTPERRQKLADYEQKFRSMLGDI